MLNTHLLNLRNNPQARRRLHLAGLAWLCLLPGLASAATLQLFVSVLPLKTFVDKIGGKPVSVQTMVPAGQSPATYSPSPRQIARLAEADAYIRIGVPFESAWLQRIRSANPDMPIIDARQGIELQQLTSHLAHTDPENSVDEMLDPHIWTSPPLAKRILANIHTALVNLAPAHKATFDAGYADYRTTLSELDQHIRQQLAKLDNRYFMVFHPAWGYYADTYGLTQLAIEQAGKSPGAKQITSLVKLAEQHDIHTLFVQPQFNPSLTRRLAKSIGAQVVTIDPLDPAYCDTLRQLTQAIAETNH